jgi:serine phosphatase RsbU (regulator of sigma subunit)/antitoxin component YwqK of YwqJK toxin-antitoxin module
MLLTRALLFKIGIKPLHLFMLLGCILFCGSEIQAQPENNLGITRKLINIKGIIYGDSNQNKALEGVLIEVKYLTNADSQIIDGIKNVNYTPRYSAVGSLKTDKNGFYQFHLDFNKQYLVRFSSAFRRPEEVVFSTYLPSKMTRDDGILGSYYSSGVLSEAKNVEETKQLSGVESTVAYNENEEKFLRVNKSKKENNLEANSSQQSEREAEAKSKKLELSFLEDPIESSLAIIFEGDTINLLDSNLNKQGVWTYFDELEENDEVIHPIFSGRYANHEKTGPWKKFFLNRKKSIELGFDENRFNGGFKTFFESGALESEGFLNRSKKIRQGIFKRFYTNGQNKLSFNYNTAGERSGQQLAFYENGSLAVSASYRDGVLDGPLHVMDILGNILETRFYESGVLVDTKKYKNGKIELAAKELLNLMLVDSETITNEVIKALNQLDQLENDFDTILNEKLEQLEQLKSKLSLAELNALRAKQRSERFEALNALNEERIRRNNWLLLSAAIVLLVISSLIILLFKKNKEKSRTNILLEKQKQHISEQHEQLAEKSKEITDSIIYAKRIQEAILPPGRLVKAALPNSFILYKPKDIVAGDFYWMETVDDLVIFAAADCTGHGVPGAMVSVVCSNALNRAVREFGLTEPAKILDKTLELVIERFEKSEEDVKDGMDIALCALNSKTNELQFAGANNPLWIIKGADNALLETKATKQPIGKYADPKPYVNHVMKLEKGDSLYVFSDGFPDQFGGEKGKKLKTKAFKELLLSVQDKSMAEQHKTIDQYFENWRGDQEQIDDVCVIGVSL